jgi:peptide deformylase
MIIPNKLKLTHRVLKNVAKLVTFEDARPLMRLSTMMHEFMDRAGAIGLAAPQVGISRRVFVINVDGIARTCFNPEFSDATTDQLFECQEGCLSFPDEYVQTHRPRKIWARYQTIEGEWREEELEGMAAVCYQHELDHLDGITMHDREENGKNRSRI